MNATAVIVNFNGGTDLASCVVSALAQPDLAEVVVVDNGSSDGSWQTLDTHERLRILRPSKNLGFAGGANFGARDASCDSLIFLNPDVVLQEGCVAALLRSLEAAPGVAGPLLHVDALGATEFGATVNHLGMPVGLRLAAPPLFIAGCALGITTAIFRAVGGFNESFFLFAEDLEICWRVLLSGGDVRVVQEARAWHRGGGSIAGGYPVLGSRYVTSNLRVSLRERNTLATFLICAPAWWLPILIPPMVCRSVGEAAFARSTGNPDLAVALIEGVRWNIRHLRLTLRRRHSLRVNQSFASPPASRRLTHRPLLLSTLLKHGRPVIG